MASDGTPDTYPFWKGMGIALLTILLVTAFTYVVFGVVLYG